MHTCTQAEYFHEYGEKENVKNINPILSRKIVQFSILLFAIIDIEELIYMTNIDALKW
jgi:hypothetical protein